MNVFLAGFVNELVKVGVASPLTGTNFMRDTGKKALPAPGSGQAKPPSAPKPVQPGTVTGKLSPQKMPALPGAKPIQVGRGWRAQIGVQRMESPAAAPKRTRFRPSAGYSPDPSSDPTPAKKPSGGRGRSRARKERERLPFETSPQMRSRQRDEARGAVQRAAKLKAAGPNYGDANAKKPAPATMRKSNYRGKPTGRSFPIGINTGDVGRNAKSIGNAPMRRADGRTAAQVAAAKIKKQQASTQIAGGARFQQ